MKIQKIAKAFRQFFNNKKNPENSTEALEVLGDRELRRFYADLWETKADDLIYLADILKIIKTQKGRENILTTDELFDFFQKCKLEIEIEVSETKERTRDKVGY